MNKYFKLETADGVALLTFDHAVKRNPFNEDTLSEMEANIIAVRDDSDVRAMVLTGAGNTFSAGADLSHMKGVTDEAERVRLVATAAPKRQKLVRRVMELLKDLEIPTVAAVNGYAVGGGFFLMLACDFRFAVAGAEFWMPEVDLGSPGPRKPEQWLAAHIGPARAKEIIMTCRHIKAEELYQWGLINRVVSKAELMPAAMELAHYLATRKVSAVRQAKANINGYSFD